MIFNDRTDGGRRLAERLRHLRGRDLVVLGLPRGGVPVAAEVAEALDAPLDLIVVRKLGVPYQPELAMGAIGEGGVRVVDHQVVGMARVSEGDLALVEERQRAELDRLARRLRGGRPRARIEGRTAIVVDDGVATGSTARAACRVAHAQGATHVVLAVPVAPYDWTARLARDADELVAVETPHRFSAVGEWYADFAQTSDEEVIGCLERAAARQPSLRPAVSRYDEVEVRAGPLRLAGHLTLPEGATGAVLFSHGSGSSRHSPRNRYVAEALNRAGLGTLLFDLLTVAEERDRAYVFDTGLLAERLLGATHWLRAEPGAEGLAVGYFGASTGAAAALVAAAEPHAGIAAVVSRGGRPDLAGPRLPSVNAPTLLVVGGHDELVLDLNRRALAQMRCESRLDIVPGATHLFEEPGALEAVADLARDWFTGHLTPAPQLASGR